jgi:hypothetical protein
VLCACPKALSLEFMIEVLLSLPTLLGCLVFMGVTTAVGLAVYSMTFRLHATLQDDDAIRELEAPPRNLLRVVGGLVTLRLSLTFSDVVSESVVTETAIASEAAAIMDVDQDLQRFGTEAMPGIRNILFDYNRAVIDDDWPALASGRLSEKTDLLLRQLEDAVLSLKPTETIQETLRTRLIADVEMISAYRLVRLQQAREQPSQVLIVVFLGYLATMVLFGIYPPRRAVVALLSLYTVFVGAVIYIVVSMGDPFQGATAIDSGPLTYALETMEDSAGNRSVALGESIDVSPSAIAPVTISPETSNDGSAIK